MEFSLLSEEKMRKERLAKIRALGIDPYPNHSKRTQSILNMFKISSKKKSIKIYVQNVKVS